MGPSMEVPEGYDEFKEERIRYAKKRLKFEKETEYKTQYYIV